MISYEGKYDYIQDVLQRSSQKMGGVIRFLSKIHLTQLIYPRVAFPNFIYSTESNSNQGIHTKYLERVRGGLHSKAAQRVLCANEVIPTYQPYVTTASTRELI